MIAVDVGFGWTKCIKGGDNPVKWKFPTWIAYWNQEPISEVKTISYDGKEYVVGEVARHSKHRIEISSFEDLIKWTPIILNHITNTIGGGKIIGGIPPKYYAQYMNDINMRVKLESMYEKVYPQGMGILADVENSLNLEDSETVLVLDVGFNTVDYFLVMYEDRGQYSKIAGGTLEGIGILKAVEIFRSRFENGTLRDLSRSQLIKTFEKGTIKIEGKTLNLEEEKKVAIEVYSNLLSSRLKSELSVSLSEADRVVLAGGGAYILSFLKDFRQDIFIPLEPEFSNVRGYLRLGA